MSRTEIVRDRTQRILEELFRTGSLSVEQISTQFAISIATARRDLEMLEKQGRLRRTHGGAIAVEPLLYEPFRHDSSFQEQIDRHAEEKRRIAMAAAELIADGDTIALTAGTTTTQVTRSIPPRMGVTVVTNTVNIAMELSQRKDIDVLVTGGFLRGDWFSLVGQTAMHTVGQLVFDKMFIGVNGIDIRWGLTTFNADEAAINRAMVSRAKQRIVVADHAKLGLSATYQFWDIEHIDMLITDSGATDDAVAPYLERNIDVRRV